MDGAAPFRLRPKSGNFKAEAWGQGSGNTWGARYAEREVVQILPKKKSRRTAVRLGERIVRKLNSFNFYLLVSLITHSTALSS